MLVTFEELDIPTVELHTVLWDIKCDGIWLKKLFEIPFVVAAGVVAAGVVAAGVVAAGVVAK